MGVTIAVSIFPNGRFWFSTIAVKGSGPPPGRGPRSAPPPLGVRGTVDVLWPFVSNTYGKAVLRAAAVTGPAFPVTGKSSGAPSAKVVRGEVFFGHWAGPRPRGSRWGRGM